MLKLRNADNYSIKKQWYILYSLVLLLPIIVMLIFNRLSYKILADTVYDYQLFHLAHVKDMADAEFASLSVTMSSFSSNQLLRDAVAIKDPVQEQKMLLLRDSAEHIYNAGINQTLVKHYSLYLPESDYLLEGRHIIPRRLLSSDIYQGSLLEKDCKIVFDQADNKKLGLMLSSNDELVLYTKLPVLYSKSFLHVAAVLSPSELVHILNNKLALDEHLIGIMGLCGDVYFCNDTLPNESFQKNKNGWFYQEIESEILPIRYFYASPTYIVEEKLSLYRQIIMGYVAVCLILGLFAIRIAVKHQYVPIERLMEHFSTDECTQNNEYKNISDYLLQVQKRNDHHFMTDVLLGTIPDSRSLLFSHLLLLTHSDGETVFHIDPAETQLLLPNAKVVNIYEHTVIVLQDNQLSETQIKNALDLLVAGTSFYAIFVQSNGESLHQAYIQATDMLATLRFFHFPTDKIYHADSGKHDSSLLLMSNRFEEEFRSNIFSRNEQNAKALMQRALDDLQAKCRYGSVLRSSLYTISLLFIRLEAAVRTQNPNAFDGVSGEVVRSYRYKNIEQLQDASMQAIHDMIAVLDVQNSRKSSTLPEQIDSFIQENYQNPDLNVDMIADHVGFSSVYLRRVYKQSRGTNITDAILHLRINAAKQTLAKPGSKVNEVALQVGFWDAGTFIRSFKKLEGITPGAYKSQQLNSPMCSEELNDN